ncbi:MAG TPA: hypothetical protein EYM91_00070 [Acidobacteria bacterium]|nr:hypothetical protein [Acidobacteriota bacterium]
MRRKTSAGRSVVKSRFFQKYLLPGFVFQSLVIAGGYGTGRELVQFFLRLGPITGLLAMGVTTLIWSAVAASSFELARLTKSYDYRTFFTHLLGRGWFFYEILYFLQGFLVLAVVAAAAGAILHETFGAPSLVGVIGMMVAIGFLTLRGTQVIERFLASWSFVLYAAYGVFFVWCWSRFGDAIVAGLSGSTIGQGWLLGGVTYAGYNLQMIPAILFCMRHSETRRQALGAGALTGPIAMLPGLLFYVSMVGQYPAILSEAVPANVLLELVGSRAFQIVFQVVLFGTLIETGAGLVHAVNERLAATYAERGLEMPVLLRPAIAIGMLSIGALSAQVGLKELIESGYGTITWGFIIVFVIPVLTLGVWKILQAHHASLSKY